MIGSAIGMYVYLRVIYTMALGDEEAEGEAMTHQLIHNSPLSLTVVVVLILAVLGLGIFPQVLIDYLSLVVS